MLKALSCSQSKYQDTQLWQVNKNSNIRAGAMAQQINPLTYGAGIQYECQFMFWLLSFQSRLSIEKATEHGPTPWDSASTEGTQKKLLAPGSGSA